MALNTAIRPIGESSFVHNLPNADRQGTKIMAHAKYHGIHSECCIVILLQLCVCLQPTYIYFSSGVS